MLQTWKNWCWKLTISGAIIALSGNSGFAQSQIVPDSTLGAESSVVTPNVLINGLPGEQIDGGAKRGANLFHSFDEFSIPTGSAAYFNNTADIQNIISRVTGGSISNIDGLLRANHTANLFLLNPNGIIFGPNATLAIGGSFVASTASSLRFADQTQFSATQPQATPLLTVSVPVGLQFGGRVGSIVNQSVAVNSSGIPGLQVDTGKTLALVGGNVELPGSNLTAEAGRIELGSVAGSSLVSLTPTKQGWTLGYEGVGKNFRDITLSQGAVVDVSGASSGDIQMQGRRVSIRDGSQLSAVNSGSRSGGNVTVSASDSVELSGSLTIGDAVYVSSLSTITQGAGTAGNISITTRKLLLQNGAQVSTTTTSLGQGGTLQVNASDSVELIATEPTGQFASSLLTRTLDAGNAGTLSIKTGRLIVRDGANASVSSEGSGAAGNLEVTARSILLDNGAALRASSEKSGAAGNLEVTARSILLDNGAALSADSSSGKEGQINLQVKDLLVLRHNSRISTIAGSESTGGIGGNITIKNPFIVAVASENSDILANAFQGPGGNAQIMAQEIFGTQIRRTPTPESDITASGSIELETPTFIDPSRGIVTLPAELVDVAGLITPGCSVGGGGGGTTSEFIVTGRGGLPPTPREALASEPALADLGTLVQGQENANRAATSTNSTSSQPVPLVEAQGWVIGSNGEVVLTAQAPTVTAHSPWLTPTTCHGS